MSGEGIIHMDVHGFIRVELAVGTRRVSTVWDSLSKC